MPIPNPNDPIELFTQIDIEGRNYLVEVTTGRGNKHAQTLKYLDPIANPQGKPVLVYNAGDKWGKHVKASVEQHGAIVVQKYEELLQWLK